ncbi:MAG: ABC transporter substrate-binding protein [Symbiobacteriaceae bacterium]|nr:ABC transporter substrate-binding protein [Symbiobacteriaceae bacterium]
MNLRLITKGNPEKITVLLLGFLLIMSACNTTQSNAVTNPANTTSTPSAATEAPPAVSDGKSIVSGGNTFILGQTTDIQYLVPFRTTDSRSGLVIYYLSEGLVRYEGSYNLVPCLATDYTLSDDGLVWTFKLREGVTFHDGSPFTSADVKFTYESLLDPDQKSNQRVEYGFIDYIETPDDLTVIFNLKQPFGPALYRFTMGILCKEYVQSNGFDQNGYANYNPVAVGTGPYKMVDWKPDVAVYLAANESYWGKVPDIKFVEVRPIPDNAVRLAAFEAGEIDYIMGIPPIDVDRILADKGKYEGYVYPGIGFTYLTWNTQIELFKDPVLRQALTMATDKDEIINNVLFGHAVKCITPYSPAHVAYIDIGEPFPFNPQKAVELLEQAGYTKGSDGIYISPKGIRCSFETLVGTEGTVNTEIAQILQQRFKEVGVELKLTSMALGLIYDIMDAVIFGEAEEETYASMIGAMGINADPDITRYMHSGGGLNDYRYMNPDLDALLELGVVTFEAEKSKDIYREVLEIFAYDLPCLFLYHAEAISVSQNIFSGFEATPYGNINNLSNVSIR